MWKARAIPFLPAAASITLIVVSVNFIRVLQASMEPSQHHHHTSSGSNSSSSSGGGHSGHQHNMKDMMMMPMWFQFTFDTVLWFKEWETDSWATYTVASIFLVVFGILHEALASYRVSLMRAQSGPVTQGYAAMPGEGPISDTGPTWMRACTSLLYAGNLATGYLLMLAVMTYNAGFFLAVLLGMGLGHFLCFTKPWHRQHVRVDPCCESASTHLSPRPDI